MQFSSNKIACISDIHLGVHQDSQIWHNIALDFARWLDKTLKENKIRDIIISGDIFHNRHEIGVNTIHCASNFFDILKDYNIIAITGNHDCYYKDKSDINSVSILNRNNVTVYQTLETTEAFNKKITFCPWGVELEQIPKSDIIFGHFEIVNFKMNTHKVCDHGFETESLLDKGDIIITGHFHIRDHRKYTNDKSILYLGSPYELDFGDRDQTKGVTILDINTLETELIVNQITPKHKKIKLSDLLNDESQIENIGENITNNFVSLNVDVEVKPQVLDIYIAKLSQHKPKQLRTDFNIFQPLQLSATAIKEFSINIDTALHEFVDLLDTAVSKKDILDKCLELYKHSYNNNE
jgi:DNA repair exonuclease SbcCD nuclease subunit